MYWACARTELRREAVAVRYLRLAGYETYLPQLRAQRRVAGRKIEARLPLFPNYCFLAIEGAWHSARWTVGVLSLIMDGERPARVPDAVIAEIRSRERKGLVELPSRFKRGDAVRILRGPFREQVAIYAGMKAHERVDVLLSLLGGEHRVTLPRGDVEAV